jgi:hypothetical protein
VSEPPGLRSRAVLAGIVHRHNFMGEFAAMADAVNRRQSTGKCERIVVQREDELDK